MEYPNEKREEEPQPVKHTHEKKEAKRQKLEVKEEDFPTL